MKTFLHLLFLISTSKRKRRLNRYLNYSAIRAKTELLTFLKCHLNFINCLINYRWTICFNSKGELYPSNESVVFHQCTVVCLLTIISYLFPHFYYLAIIIYCAKYILMQVTLPMPFSMSFLE